ncbi:MAG: hypothetical protein A4E57_04870 [Syntrophorhabdaceae bacterium PtaU1.Bin034]|nr:MAG: hypothetical protein A4E57_04870 [Syntrophorhabdaceae bacterium PtaU1.Bin034]
MARTPRGREVLEKAKELLSKARTVEELRQAQAVILPLEYGFSMERTGAITGVSKGWRVTCEQNSFVQKMRFVRRNFEEGGGART